MAIPEVKPAIESIRGRYEQKMSPRWRHPMRFVWSITALSCVALLAACAGAKSSDTSSNTGANAGTAAPYAVATANSPCNLPGAWYFQGSCTVENVTSGGAVMVLREYRGISIAVTFGDNDAASRVPFVLGDAYDNGDISGLLNGRIRFAGFGKTKCLTPGRTPVPCIGTAVIYLIVVNAGAQTVTFKSTPTIALLSVQGYPGKKCGIATMVWANAGRGEAAWVVRPFTTEPNEEKLRFDATDAQARYASGATFASYAIVCS
jgi:hypothetical protein